MQRRCFDDYMFAQCVMSFFFKKFNLKKHIIQFYIRIMFFRCDICDFIFERKNHLSKHFKIYIKNFDFVFNKITKN